MIKSSTHPFPQYIDIKREAKAYARLPIQRGHFTSQHLNTLGQGVMQRHDEQQRD